MMMMITVTLLTLTILALMMIFFFKIQTPKLNDNSSFECGFNQKTSSLMPFSTQFFLITILFLIFDLEIALFMPFIMMEEAKANQNLFTMSLMVILTMGLIFEWKEGMIEWAK